MWQLNACFVAVAAAGCLAVPCAADARPPTHAPACTPITETQVAALFDRWNKALETKNPDAVIANYAADATLLPTVESGPLIGPVQIRPYFVHFLESSPSGAIDKRVIHIGCNIAYDIGLYTFTVAGAAPGSHDQIHARYSFIYAPDHGRWLIVHHHSSKVPPAK
jgi:uncharacterized protein (TIGR02246 family)